VQRGELMMVEVAGQEMGEVSRISSSVPRRLRALHCSRSPEPWSGPVLSITETGQVWQIGLLQLQIREGQALPGMSDCMIWPGVR
jgi:hypothetical protein